MFASPFANNVSPEHFLFADNVSRKTPCLQARRFMFASHYKYGSIGHFNCQALILIAGNQEMSNNDSAIGRRRILVPFENQVPSEKCRRDLIKDFMPYLPGLLNKIIEMAPEKVEQLIRSTDKYVTSLKDHKHEMLLSNHPLAAWFFDCLEVNENEKTYVGRGNENEAHEKLYANYIKYCKQNAGKPKLISLQLFSRKLLDLCFQMEPKPKIIKTRDTGGAFFQGLMIKSDIQGKTQLSLVGSHPMAS